METTVTFDINEIGEETGTPYTGLFTVKTILTRQDRFGADRERRRILGGDNPDQAMPGLQGEAFMLGQLSVRVVDAPKFWKDSLGGLLLEDGNVIGRVFEIAIAKENERREKLQKQSGEALTKLAGKRVDAQK